VRLAYSRDVWPFRAMSGSSFLGTQSDMMINVATANNRTYQLAASRENAMWLSKPTL